MYVFSPSFPYPMLSFFYPILSCPIQFYEGFIEVVAFTDNC